MLRKPTKSNFKPKVAGRRNAATTGPQSSEPASQSPALTASQPQVQAPAPRPSPVPSLADNAPQVAEPPTPSTPSQSEKKQPARRSTPRGKPARDAPVELVTTTAIEAPTNVPSDHDPTPSADPAAQSEGLPTSRHVPPNDGPPPAAAPIPTPPSTSAAASVTEETSNNTPAIPQNISPRRVPARSRANKSLTTGAPTVAAQTVTPSASSTAANQSQPTAAETGPSTESENAEPSAAPRASAPRGRTRRTAAVVAEDGANQEESPAATTKRPRAARRAAALPGEEGYQTAAERRATANSTKRSRKRKSPGEVVEEAEAQSGEGDEAQPRKRPSRVHREATPEDAENAQIDVTQVKMADLIKDMRVGKKFSLHDELVERERLKRQKKKPENPDEAVEKNGTPAPGGADGAVGADVEAEGRTSTLAPAGETYRIINGEIVLDQSSLTVNRQARAAQEAGEMEEHEENDFTHHTTSATYLRRNMRPGQWSDEETEKLYWALSMFGTDFETIARMFPGKMRKHIKLKFNREERTNPTRIQSALVGQKTVGMDMEEYKRHTGSEYETAEAIYAEQKKAEEEFEAKQKAIQDAKDEETRRRREELFGSGNKEAEGQGAVDEGAKKKKGRGRKAKRNEATW